MSGNLSRPSTPGLVRIVDDVQNDTSPPGELQRREPGTSANVAAASDGDASLLSAAPSLPGVKLKISPDISGLLSGAEPLVPPARFDSGWSPAR